MVLTLEHVSESLGGLLRTVTTEIGRASSRIQEVRVGLRICTSDKFLLQEHALSITVLESLIRLLWAGVGLTSYLSKLPVIPMCFNVQPKLRSPQARVQHG